MPHMNLLNLFGQFRRKSEKQVVLRTIISKLDHIPDIERSLYMEAVLVLSDDELQTLAERMDYVLSRDPKEVESLILEIPNYE